MCNQKHKIMLKKITLAILILTVIAPISTLAQQEPQNDTVRKTVPPEVTVQKRIRHITYKGIPVTGTVDVFEKDLLDDGFKPKSYGNNGVITSYSGNFAGYDVTTYLLYTPISSTVYGVETFFPERYNWEDVEKDFKLFKKHLGEIYGIPVKDEEIFKMPYMKGDGYSLKALREKKANINCIWDNNIGLVGLSIVSTKNGASLKIIYMDMDGMLINDSEKSEIIKRDL